VLVATNVPEVISACDRTFDCESAACAIELDPNTQDGKESQS
jgi:hypothetical protein